MIKRPFLAFCGLLLHQIAVAEAVSAAPDFNKDVRPILSEHCFACHGPDERSRKAGLRLDTKDAAHAPLEKHPEKRALAAGNLEKSEAWQRILSTDADEVMPPPEAHLPLSDLQRDVLKRWIQGGAEYAAHWAYTAPMKQPAPAGAEIDHFVSEGLKTSQLEANGPESPETLARRVSLDLLGLPAEWPKVAKFVENPSPEAYAAYVDELLASPHFGERLALDWLDAARYADTNGFSIDGGRHMWLWRDWVIQAFNSNKRYDQFLLEQLAGDLMPGAGPAEKIASGFQRNNMVTHEGGTIPEENLTNYNADRVKTLGEAVMGLTLACAQCHDHKYDPISQKEYFQLFAYFNTLSDKGLDGNAGINPGPVFQTKTVLQTPEIPELERRIAALQEQITTPNPGIQQAWETEAKALEASRGKDLKLTPLKLLKVSTPNRGSGFEVEEQRAVRLKSPGDMGAFDIASQIPPDLSQPINGIRVTMHPVATNPGNGWGSGGGKKRRGQPAATPAAKGTFVLTALSITPDTTANDMVNLHKLAAISRATANSWEPEWPATGCLDPRNDSGWQPDIETDGPVHLTATFATPIDPKSAPFFTVQLNFGRGGGLIPELITLDLMSGTDDGTDLPADVLASLQTPEAARTPEQKATLWTHCAAHTKDLEATRISLANLKSRLTSLTQPHATMVMNEAPKPRQTFILNRGDYSQPTTPVGPGVPSVLPPLPANAPQNRLGLAQWLIDPKHPLTARVAVNRIWKLFFGTGLVATAADFGAQGEPPSHPALLDWLAVDFVEHGWDLKRLVRQIVTSQSYRRSSAATQAQLENDPSNRKLARGPRFRLPAELIRDNALAASGLLVPWIGGPSVNPYAPGDLWREVSHYGSSPATAQTFVQDRGENLYRRSLYTYWKRTAPPPNMTAFDAPNREVCTISRGLTNTPLQALVTLNDPQFVEAGRALAQRVLQTEKEQAERLRLLFRLVLNRNPSEKEMPLLTQSLARQMNHFTNKPAAATALLEVGESAATAEFSPTLLAAWAQVASMVLNLSEAVTRF